MDSYHIKKEKMPKVSVIIPNYNHSRYLDQRIQSVLNQTYQDFEVIILDDCSNDNSIEIISKYKDNPHVSHIVINQSNSGSTFKQWRKGLELAIAEIIWIAESDDWCELNFLDVIMRQWHEHPDCAIIQSASCYVNETGCVIKPNESFTGNISVLSGKDAIQNHLICSNVYIPNASAVTFKKQYALMLDKDYMEFKASGDRLFWIYMLEKGGICKIDLPLNFFRQHELNKVSKTRELDGTQCRENYNINRYLHKKKYITGKYNYTELRFYWEYIHTFNFLNESIRKSLLDLWFPGIRQNVIFYNIKLGHYLLLPLRYLYKLIHQK